MSARDAGQPRSGSSPGETSSALVSAVYFVLIYLVYSLVLRAANGITLARSGNLSFEFFGPPFSLPFLLGEELVLGVVLALILGMLWPWRALRLLWSGVLGLYLVFLAVDQLAFKLFFGHLDYVLYSTSHDFVRLWSSISATFDGFFVVNLLFGCLFAVALFVSFRPRFVRGLAALVARRPLATVLAGAGYCALTVVLVCSSEQHGLERSFPVAYFSSYLQVRAEERRLAQAVAGRHLQDPAVQPSEPSAGENPAQEPTPEAPVTLNVVWYLMESASFRETSLAAKNRYQTTPFLQDLARRSLLLTNYYTSYAASTRSFFSSLTGLYPYVDKSPDLTKYSRLEVQTLVDILHQAGYTTGFFASSDTMFESMDTFLANRPYDIYLDRNLLPRRERDSAPAGEWGVEEELMIDRALAWIAEVKDSDKPFYLNYNAVYPHHPFRVPRQHRAALSKMDWGPGDELKSRYRASLYYADMSLRRFYEGLERLQVLDNTLFVVTADHGETFGDLHSKNLIHAEYCYNEDLHIFLVLHNPELLGPPQKNHRLGTHVDLLPTILDVLGREPPPGINGQSLISADYQQRTAHFLSRRHLGLIDGSLKFVTPRDRGNSELYDLGADPDEQTNIAGRNPEKVQKYEQAVWDWMAYVAGVYRDKLAATGLDERKTEKLAKEARGKRFGHVRARIASAAICTSGNRTACASSPGPTFSLGQPLVVRVGLKSPGTVGLRVEIIDPGGTKILRKKVAHQAVKEAIFAEVPGELFQTAGRYRVRALVLSSQAIHDSTSFHFQISE